jgi:hypothetical protein
VRKEARRTSARPLVNTCTPNSAGTSSGTHDRSSLKCEMITCTVDGPSALLGLALAFALAEGPRAQCSLVVVQVGCGAATAAASTCSKRRARQARLPRAIVWKSHPSSSRTNFNLLVPL